uniref:Uncharacterized protein n=1 Tax=Rhizophora mucronata TaxID=61149 RepID=A0A2P2N425_RHIMU
MLVLLKLEPVHLLWSMVSFLIIVDAINYVSSQNLYKACLKISMIVPF